MSTEGPKRRFRTGGLAAWSIRRPVAVVMLSLAVVVLGLFSLERLGVDLLPHLIYPEIRVRVMDPGVPARIMEDRVTRQLEEQLAITEGAVGVQSYTTEGRSSVDLSFPYGTDIDLALRDASARLDRAKRFLPETIDPPVIYKRDPSQIPVLEFVVSSAVRDPVALRSWVDYSFAKWFLNLPGVAAAEVGGGLVREIQVLVDQERLAGLGFTFQDLADALTGGNQEIPGGRLRSAVRELGTRTAGRFRDVAELATLPLWRNGTARIDEAVRLAEVAQVVDTHRDERLRIRLNGVPGVKLSIQKQPQANTVAAVDAVNRRLDWLRAQGLIPADIQVHRVGDQSTYVRHALRNATLAALSGALLAMTVVYLFLGSLRRTLIIGTAIPIAILVTFVLMDLGGLTLNIMTLGGLALGVGMLVDSTIVMLENIHRHLARSNPPDDAPVQAAAEVNSAIVASTSTNLAAVLPFLFIGGLVGLLFRELIFTISAAIVASLVVALTLVPALGARIRTTGTGGMRRLVDRLTGGLQRRYARLTGAVLRRPWLPVAVFVPALAALVPVFLSTQQTFLPRMDEGQIFVGVTGDPGIKLDEMDRSVRVLETLFLEQPEVATVFTQAGGWVFGRSEYESGNRSSFRIQLVPVTQRAVSSEQWIRRMQEKIRALALPGVRVRMHVRGIRGVRLGLGDDDISLRVQGPDLDTLARIGDEIVARLHDVPGLRNLRHTYEESREELAVTVDRERAADLGVGVEDVGRALRVALDGWVVTDYIEGDRQYDVRLRLPRRAVTTPEDLGRVLVRLHAGRPVRLRDVARVTLVSAPGGIQRDRQRRIVEISASLAGGASLDRVMAEIRRRLDDLELPDGYSLYDGGADRTLKEGRRLGYVLLGLAVFLVFVAMAAQYESLRNPLVILFSVPFTLIGVATGLWLMHMPLSIPVWLGLIMLAGIVVNNAIVLVEHVEIERERGRALDEALVEAARLRLRPILMTALTTVAGMTPLALGVGEGSEMLQPLAVVIVSGLSFSTLVSLVLVPAVYRLMHSPGARA